MPALLVVLAAAAAVALLGAQPLAAAAATADCPLELGWTNFTYAASVCSDQNQRGKCCRFINAFVAVSVSRYASSTGKLGVPAAFAETCLAAVAETLEKHGVPTYAMDFCGLGTKILINCQCEGRSTVLEMLQSPNFGDVISSCEPPISMEGNCRRCLSAGMVYIHRLVGAQDNVTLSTCRGAIFVALNNQGKNLLAIELVSCFFGIQASALQTDPLLESPSPSYSPYPPSSRSPYEHVSTRRYQPYHLTLIPVVGIAVTGTATLLLAFLILLIHRKRKELKVSSPVCGPSHEGFPSLPHHRFSEGCSFSLAAAGLLLIRISSILVVVLTLFSGIVSGPRSAFQRFSFKETKRATNNFESMIGKGGFGTVYRAEFGDGLVVAVKRMDKVSEQGEDEFCREMELLGRLHHRHLVALRASGRAPLSWQMRIQIAIDVANALEYLHFYCDPPLCHRDVKSSNILLDDNFVAKLADFGLAHASRSGSICFEPVNTDIRGTPGYMDPEYVITQELTEKSDVYSYGVVLLELVTGRRAIQENRNLVEWSQKFMASESTLPGLVDPLIRETVDLEQLQAIVWIIRWCTQREGKARPSIRQVLRLLYERLDPPLHGEEEEGSGGERSAAAKERRGEGISASAGLPSSSSTSRSYCSRSLLLEGGSPASPARIVPRAP